MDNLTTQQYAEQFISKLIKDAADAMGTDIAKGLEYAELLTPNLPAPTKIDDYVYCWSKTHTHLMNDWSAGVATEVEARGGVTALAWDDDAQVWIDVDHGEQILTPEDARSLGLALLAAANHAQEEQ